MEWFHTGVRIELVHSTDCWERERNTPFFLFWCQRFLCGGVFTRKKVVLLLPHMLINKIYFIIHLNTSRATWWKEAQEQIDFIHFQEWHRSDATSELYFFYTSIDVKNNVEKDDDFYTVGNLKIISPCYLCWNLNVNSSANFKN